MRRMSRRDYAMRKFSLREISYLCIRGSGRIPNSDIFSELVAPHVFYDNGRGLFCRFFKTLGQPRKLKNGDKLEWGQVLRGQALQVLPEMYIVWFTVWSFVIGKFCNVSKDYRLRIGGVPDKNIVLRQTVWSCVINQTIVF